MNYRWLMFTVFIIVLSTVGVSHLEALTPVTPRLNAEAHLELSRLLETVKFPRVGINSVEIALTTVLGIKPTAQQYQYREPWPHLPLVNAVAKPNKTGCVMVALTAWYESVSNHRIKLKGEYCHLEQGMWNAKNQKIKAIPANH